MTALISPRALIIGYVWPEPRSSAAGSRMLQLIQQLIHQGYQVIFATPAKSSDHAEDLQALGVHPQPIAVNDPSFDGFLQTLQPHLVIFDRFLMEEQFGWRVQQHCPEAIRILNTEDLHALRQVRHQRLKAHQKTPNARTDFSPSESLTPETLYPYLASEEITLREVAACLRSDLTLMISPFEHQLLQRYFQVPDSHLQTVSFQYENAKIPSPESLPSFEQRQHCVFIGNFRHAPNWDAVLQLKELWPSIRQQIPKVELHIYGAYPPKKLQALHNDKHGFLVKGWADHAFDVIQNARLLLAPLRFGAGIKGKLAEAMFCGTPSITTLIGAEGMVNLPEEWPGAIAPQKTAFIESVSQLYSQQETWQDAQKKGFKHAQNYLSASKDSVKDLKEGSPKWLMQIATLIQDPEQRQQHRLRNFTGQILNHHQHQSTKYFSQWIEAKNQNNATPPPLIKEITKT